jgi:hypothetical protein
MHVMSPKTTTEAVNTSVELALPELWPKCGDHASVRMNRQAMGLLRPSPKCPRPRNVRTLGYFSSAPDLLHVDCALRVRSVCHAFAVGVYSNAFPFGVISVWSPFCHSGGTSCAMVLVAICRIVAKKRGCQKEGLTT